jgi:two-component system sensor histidine kinase and response regulator WspE
MDAWARLRDWPCDLVVTDVDMPRMDGIELTRSIKQDPRLRALPVVIVSYRDRPEDRARGLEVKADAYLTKSDFQEHGFLDVVQQLIGDAEVAA